jgi:hypothetical protein
MAIAIRNPETAVLFERGKSLETLTERLVEALDEAEAYLDRIAAEAKREARKKARSATPLIKLLRIPVSSREASSTQSILTRKPNRELHGRPRRLNRAPGPSARARYREARSDRPLPGRFTSSQTRNCGAPQCRTL